LGLILNKEKKLARLKPRDIVAVEMGVDRPLTGKITNILMREKRKNSQKQPL